MPQLAYDLTRRYTVEEVLAFPDDGNRYELIDGVLLVSPSPRHIHQAVLGLLHIDLGIYLRTLGVDFTLCMAPADITWGPHTLVQPDLFITRPEELSQDWHTVQRLRLAIEVISPSSGRRDRFTKRLAYQKHGVETYWIVDPYEETVEVWTPSATEPVRLTDVVTWRYAPQAPSLTVDLPALWERAARGLDASARAATEPEESLAPTSRTPMPARPVSDDSTT